MSKKGKRHSRKNALRKAQPPKKDMKKGEKVLAGEAKPQGHFQRKILRRGTLSTVPRGWQ